MSAFGRDSITATTGAIVDGFSDFMIANASAKIDAIETLSPAEKTSAKQKVVDAMPSEELKKIWEYTVPNMFAEIKKQIWDKAFIATNITSGAILTGTASDGGYYAYLNPNTQISSGVVTGRVYFAD